MMSEMLRWGAAVVTAKSDAIGNRPAVAPQHEQRRRWNAIIEARGLTKTYSGATRNVLALEDVNFQIKRRRVRLSCRPQRLRQIDTV